MKINCNPEKFLKREGLLPGCALKYKEKLEYLDINTRIDFSKEIIDENGYSYLNNSKILK